jgi:hypothetical protein
MPKKSEKKSPLEKRSRCPKGTVRNKKTGLCEAKPNVEMQEVENIETIAKKKSPKNKTQKAAANLLKERRECIEKWRQKHIRNSSSTMSSKK